MKAWAERPWAVAMALAAFVLLTQVGGLRHELEWDESTFMVLASQLLDGELPYVGAFDNKPPMIFFEFAGAMWIMGENLVAVRIFGDLCILATALLTVAVTRRFAAPLPSVLAGMVYVAMASIHEGQPTMSELPATALVLGGLWFLLAGGARVAILAGALISLAVLTRTNLAYVAVAGGLWLAALALLPRPTRGGLATLGAYVLGGLLPLGAVLALYALRGALDVFILATVTVPLSYVAEQLTMFEALKSHGYAWAMRMIGQPGLFVPLTLALLGGGATLAVAARRGLHADAVLVGLVAVSVVLSILGSGAVYSHYWLQAMPFAAMLAGVFLDACLRRRGGTVVAWALAGTMIASALVATVPDALRLVTQPWVVEERRPALAAARAIAPHLGPDDKVWAAHHHRVTWHLGVDPIVWVAAHPDNITRPSIVEPLKASGRVSQDVVGQIMDMEPAFVVTGRYRYPPYLPKDRFEDFLAGHYALFYEAGIVMVYRRIGHDGWFPDP